MSRGAAIVMLSLCYISQFWGNVRNGRERNNDLATAPAIEAIKFCVQVARE